MNMGTARMARLREEGEGEQERTNDDLVPMQVFHLAPTGLAMAARSEFSVVTRLLSAQANAELLNPRCATIVCHRQSQKKKTTAPKGIY